MLNLNELNFNNYSSQHNADPDEGIINPVNFSYYTTHDIHKLKQNNKNIKQELSLIHTIISSLHANFENLEILLCNLDYDFDNYAK